MNPMAAPVLVLVPPAWIGGLGVMRSLGRLGVRVYGPAHRRRLVPNASRYCAGTFPVGSEGRPLGDADTIVNELLDAAERMGEGAILLAGTDEWAVFVARNADRLAPRFRFPRMQAEVVAQLASKEGLHRLALRFGIPTPAIAIPGSSAEAVQMADAMQYPIMLKPVTSRPAVSFKAVATDADTLRRNYEAMAESTAAPNVLLQEYIPGQDEDVWMFNGYFDDASRCLAGFTGQKVRQHPTHMGHCSLGVCHQNPALIDQTVRFLKALDYRGVVDIGYRFDRRDGQYKILDVNPRLGGAFRLFVAPDGLDVARALYFDYTDQPISVAVPLEGRRWLREDSELIALRRYRRADGLKFSTWLRSLRGVEETSTFSLTDPIPFIASMWLLLTNTLRGRRAPGQMLATMPLREAQASVPAQPVAK